ncbi:TVP38/TMEM64 family protein [Salipaludibacillus keqinensis]|uniref:TVP38/TMEM64 family membrane protein n=1 Tax=Salipaludibacillus keqinensis TaxID=2045207 RepID=A0A323TMI6_9BACI|nr:VTT domain-containing protein [Salipaludibacillus keqinensis]PYZ95264.1 TVP38/TMEM64 family protein [Salipaludibacillus keqinensis]
MYRKGLVLLGSTLVILALVFYHESLLHWIQNNEQDHVFLTIIIATTMSLFPVIPYPLVGSVIGAVYGPGLGAVIIWVGSTLASILFFSLIRYGGFHTLGTKILLKFSATKKLTLLFERNAFMSITIMRMIPVIPSIIINAYAALSRVRFVIYAIGSGLGKIPSMTLFAFVGHTIVTDPIELIYMIVIYTIFLAIVYSGYKLWLRKVEKQAINNQPLTENEK